MFALRRLGHVVRVINPAALLGPRGQWQNKFDHCTGYRLLQRPLLRAFARQLEYPADYFDLIWINSGEMIGPQVIRFLKCSFPCPVILYQNDDPTGARDGPRFMSLRSALSSYDLCVFLRTETELEALALGVQRSMRVFMSYDEDHHLFGQRSDNQGANSDVVFIGTFISGEERDSFILELLQAGIPVALYGNRWQRSPHWPSLKHAYKGSALYGSDYSQQLGSAAVCLGFLSHQNRDLMTRRSVEIPACYGLFCAERTSEHQLLYEEGLEVVLWTTIDECIAKCRVLLHNSDLNQKVRTAGHQHLLQLGVANEDVCRQILAAV